MGVDSAHPWQWIKLAFIGAVQQGKSTLAGCILHGLDQVSTRTMQEATKAALGQGDAALQFAYLLDRLPAERAQQGRGTRENSYWGFGEQKGRRFLLIDSPGYHKRFIHVFGAIMEADALILVVDVAQSLSYTVQSSENTGRKIPPDPLAHVQTYLKCAQAHGIRQLIVAIHKMDSVDFAQEQFEQAKMAIVRVLKDLQWHGQVLSFVPTAVSAADNVGHNIFESSARLEWFSGPTLVQAIEQCQLRTLRRIHKRIVKDKSSKLAPLHTLPFAMQVASISQGTPSGLELIIRGKIMNGRIAINDEIAIYPPNIQLRVREISAIDNIKALLRKQFWPSQKQGVGGDMVRLTCAIIGAVDDNQHVQAGALIYHTATPLQATQRLRITLTMSYAYQSQPIEGLPFRGLLTLGYFQSAFQIERFSKDGGKTWRAIEKPLLLKDVLPIPPIYPLLIDISLDTSLALSPSIVDTDLRKVILFDPEVWAIHAGRIIALL